MDTQHQTDDVIGDRYRIVAPLGQGGMGTTYEAEDLTNYQRVAIKVLSLRQIKEWKVLELFEREARVLANLEHRAIPKYLDYFPIDTPDNRRFYLVRELVRGESLADLVEKGWQANELEVKQITIQVIDILHYLHQLTPPVIHRDIKPQNIIRSPDGQVFLVDFGAVQEVYRNTLTRGGTFVGTLGYVPQEQFGGNVQPASDLYSLGATLLFLLTKRSPDELPVRRMKIDFRRYVQVLPEFGDWLEKMLEPAIEDRFQSANDALEALQNHKKVTYSVPLPTQSKPEKPERFRVERSDQHLVVEILPTGGRERELNFAELILKIDQENFRVQWMNLGTITRKIQGKTADIERIERVDLVNSNKGKTIIRSRIIFWEGVHQRRFSLGSKDEDQWLAWEASDFLIELRYGKRTQK